MNKLFKKYNIDIFQNHWYISSIIIFAGIVLRIMMFAYNESFWFDEALLGSSIVNKNYFELFGTLDFIQVAPPLFCIASKFLLNISNAGGNFAYQDLVLRIIPLIFSVLSLPLFSAVAQKFFKNNIFIWITTFVYCFNPYNLQFCQDCKQYSLESFIALVMFWIFYSLDLKNYSTKKIILLSLLFAIVPWFSLSSLFLLLSMAVTTLIFDIKDKKSLKNFFIFSVPVLTSICVFVCCYLYPLYLTTFDAQVHSFSLFDSFYKLDFSIFNFIYRFITDFFSISINKYIFAVFTILNLFLLFKQQNKRMVFCIISSILVVFLANIPKFYPVAHRLYLFIFPLIIFIYLQVLLLIKNNKILSNLILTAFIIFVFIYSHNPVQNLLKINNSRNVAEIIKYDNPQMTNIYYNNPSLRLYTKNKNNKYFPHYEMLDTDAFEQDLEKYLPNEKIYFYTLFFNNEYNDSLKKYLLSNDKIQVDKIYCQPDFWQFYVCYIAVHKK